MPDEIVVEFDCDTQSLTALQSAAYRLLSTGTCEIERLENKWRCRLAARHRTGVARSAKNQDLRTRFLDLVADENVRENISAKTEPVRNLILALAFGSLGTDQTADSK
jgi:His-Xaa-Ser system protein HxsD